MNLIWQKEVLVVSWQIFFSVTWWGWEALKKSEGRYSWKYLRETKLTKKCTSKARGLPKEDLLYISKEVMGFLAFYGMYISLNVTSPQKDSIDEILLFKSRNGCNTTNIPTIASHAESKEKQLLDSGKKYWWIAKVRKNWTLLYRQIRFKAGRYKVNRI